MKEIPKAEDVLNRQLGQDVDSVLAYDIKQAMHEYAKQVLDYVLYEKHRNGFEYLTTKKWKSLDEIILNVKSELK